MIKSAPASIILWAKLCWAGELINLYSSPQCKLTIKKLSGFEDLTVFTVLIIFSSLTIKGKI